MNCSKDGFMTDNLKSWSNHARWHKGLMNRDSYKGMNKGEKNGMWKGDDVGYDALHGWIKSVAKKKDKCEECKINDAYDLANISQKYKRDIKDWEWLCRKCHMVKDGRIKNLVSYKYAMLKM